MLQIVYVDPLLEHTITVPGSLRTVSILSDVRRTTSLTNLFKDCFLTSSRFSKHQDLEERSVYGGHIKLTQTPLFVKQHRHVRCRQHAPSLPPPQLVPGRAATQGLELKCLPHLHVPPFPGENVSEASGLWTKRQIRLQTTFQETCRVFVGEEVKLMKL